VTHLMIGPWSYKNEEDFNPRLHIPLDTGQSTFIEGEGTEGKQQLQNGKAHKLVLIISWQISSHLYFALS